MPSLTGFFDKIGSPAIKISVHGIFTDAKTEVDAVIDTGFSGFLQMPLLQAFPLGLVLYGTTQVTLADGSSSPRLVALGTIGLGSAEKVGLILLDAGSNHVLIGMGLLRKFNKTLIVSSTTVTLEDELPPAAPPAAVGPEPETQQPEAAAQPSAPTEPAQAN